MSGWLWSKHSRRRAMERLPDIDIDLELAGAQRVGHTTKAKIRKHCPVSATKYMQGFAGRFFLVSPRRVVFVVAAPNVIVTVFQLKDDYEQEIQATEADPRQAGGGTSHSHA